MTLLSEPALIITSCAALACLAWAILVVYIPNLFIKTRDISARGMYIGCYAILGTLLCFFLGIGTAATAFLGNYPLPTKLVACLPLVAVLALALIAYWSDRAAKARKRR